MASYGYTTFLGAEAIVQGSLSVHATSVSLEVLAAYAGGAVHATQTVLEVTSQVQSPVFATEIYLEVLTKSFKPVPYTPDGATPWTVPVDWTDGVTERLRWLTDVLTSDTGVEQRRRLRISPRREIDCSFIVWKETRQLVDSYLMGPHQLFHVPLFWDKFDITDIAEKGDNVLVFDTTGGEFFPNMQIMVRGSTPFIYEMAVIYAVNADRLILATSLAQTWPVGTAVFPTKIARILTGADTVATRNSDAAATIAITFQVAEPNDYPATSNEQETPPQVAFSPALLDDITTTYKRLWVEFDSNGAIPVRVDPAQQTFTLQQLDQLVRGRKQHADWRAMLYFLQGKVQPIFLPSFMADVTYLYYATSVATDSSFFINRCGLSENLGATAYGRTHLAFYLRDGTNFVVQLKFCGVVSDSVEAVYTTGPLGRDFVASDIKRISFVQYVRQDQDDIEILHVTDTKGASTFTTTFMSLSEVPRTNDGYILDYYDGSYVEDQIPAAIPVSTDTSTPTVTVDDSTPQTDLSSYDATVATSADHGA